MKRKISIMYISFFLLMFLGCLNQFKAQIIKTYAGNGIAGYGGDGGFSYLSLLNDPEGVFVDGLGNVYVAEFWNNRIRKISPTGIITTVAGTGVAGYNGNGGLATLARINHPAGVAVDALGNVYIADFSNSCVRKVNTSGIISTFAGTGAPGFSGDGGPAASAQLYGPTSVAIDASGNVFIGDDRVRKVNTAGIISTFAGIGTSAYSGDGGLAVNAELSAPRGIAFDVSGNVFIADVGNHRVRMVNSSGIISTFAGTGVAGFSGDGGNANSAQLNYPRGLAFDSSGKLYIADTDNSRIRVVNTLSVISTFAGTGVAGYGGDGSAANLALLNNPPGIALDIAGNIYIADSFNHRLRTVCPTACVLNVNSFIEKMPEVSMYPNPVINKLNISSERHELKASQIKIINQLGQMVLLLPYENEIDLSVLSSGCYLLNITTEKQEQIHSIFIKE